MLKKHFTECNGADIVISDTRAKGRTRRDRTNHFLCHDDGNRYAWLSRAARRIKMKDVERWPVTSEADWLDWHLKYITASEIAALYGVHPFCTLAEVYAQKRGLMPMKREDDMMRRGKALENVAADEVKANHKPDWVIVKADDFIVNTQLRIGATPDFYVVTPGRRRGILEIKVVSSHVFEREWADDVPPIHILLQVQHQMLLDDSDFGAIGALVIGEHTFESHLFDVPRHQATEQRILNSVAAFWAAYDEGRPPDFDFEKDREAIRALYPAHVAGKHLELHHDNRLFDLLSQRLALTETLDITNRRLTAINNEIAAKLGDAESAACGSWTITYKQQQRAAYAVAATQFRVLRAKLKT